MIKIKSGTEKRLCWAMIKVAKGFGIFPPATGITNCATPFNMIIVLNEAIIGGTRKKLTLIPIKIPVNTALAKAVRSAIGTIVGDSLLINAAKIQVVKLMTLPTERSMPPEIITTV